MPEIIVKLGDNVVHKYFLYKDTVTIGRAPDNEVSIENLAVSRHHATITLEDGRYILEDNDSANGTHVNGVRVTKTEILDKDIITVGKHKLHFYNHNEAPEEVMDPDLAQKTMLVDFRPTTTPILRITGGKQQDTVFALSKVETRIGRAADNDIRLYDWFVSKRHAVIIRKGMTYVVRDLGSWRHTMVNSAIIEEQILTPGDEIRFGPKTSAVFELLDEAISREGSGRMPVEMKAGTEAPAQNVQAAQAEPPPELEPVAQDQSASNGGGRETGSASDAVVDKVVAVQSSVVERAANGDRDLNLEEAAGVEALSESVGSPEDQIRSAEIVGLPCEVEGEEAQPESSDDSADVSPESEAEPSDEDQSKASRDAEHGRRKRRRSKRSKRKKGIRLEEPVEALATPEEAPHAESLPPKPAEVAEGQAHQSLDAPTSEPEYVERSGSGADMEEAVPIGVAAVEPAEVDSPEVSMWMKALRNPSSVIRRQAQRQLKRLTGQDYDIE